MKSPKLDERRRRGMSLHLGDEGLVGFSESRSRLGYGVNGVGIYDCRRKVRCLVDVLR